MLPLGFNWTRHIDGPALRVGEHLVASATPANNDSGAPWRICFPYSGPRYHFVASEAGAMAYMEAWAGKWEMAIRDAILVQGPGRAEVLSRYTSRDANPSCNRGVAKACRAS
ncbi:hypothetical protein SAMN06296058_1232 [Pseudoxanthomonas indica]|uniref:Uncharacterized protein n=1 Tax=Pseudoxanthomonas indica TaxID=428993 RepID=A0A1T5JZT4_9GAMM|nr:hypothetical protein GCM10007235_16920 [Pseudoxanthomonas indica]SKC56941.1 hypothetical protein SAMN06296058_1232 [Pseudoxanthomonas indica]